MSEALAEWLAERFTEALTLFNDGHHSKAESLARQVLAAIPSHEGALRLIGLCALAQGRFKEAIAWLEESCRLPPLDADKSFALGVALKGDGRLDDAISRLREAHRQAPDRIDILVILANSLQDRGECAEGLEHYRLAARLAPNNPLVRYNLGLSLLMLGRFAEGWAESEWRWKAAGFDLEAVSFGAPLWRGESLIGKTILLWAEQGYGDSIMFCRYAEPLAAMGATVLLQAPRPLLPLLSALAGVRGLYAEGEKLPSFDFHAPLLALPGRFRTDLTNIPNRIPYLAAEAKTKAKWHDRLAGLTGRKIGLTWRGNPQHANDANRSMPPSLLQPLLSVEGVSWVGLQPDPGPGAPAIFNAGPDLSDWGETAGLVANLDLLVCVDSSTAHLAGAMGKACWLMLPFFPDWRWLLARDDSPWYPSMKLWRQTSPGDWPGVISDVRLALHRHLGR